MNKYLLFYLFMFISAQPVYGQDFMDWDSVRSYELTSCNNPKNDDRWSIREPTKEEVFQFGAGILIFEYWNSVHRCSDNFYGGVWFGEKRFMMEVIVGPSMDDSREQIKLQTMDNLYYLPEDTLLLDDGEEPGRLILYPLISQNSVTCAPQHR